MVTSGDEYFGRSAVAAAEPGGCILLRFRLFSVVFVDVVVGSIVCCFAVAVATVWVEVQAGLGANGSNNEAS